MQRQSPPEDPTVGVGAEDGDVEAAIVATVFETGASTPLSRSPTKILILKA
jgi:hypothetical protein